MNEERRQTYLNLINALLNSPSGEEPQILNANQDLLDVGLLQAMAQVAEFLEKRGDRNAANFLIDVALHLAEVLGLSSSMPTSSPLPNPDSQLNFLLQVLQATYDSNANRQVVYPLLQANLDLLDDNFPTVLRSWISATLWELEQEQAQHIAGVICEFSNLLLQFPLGSKASNLEIAITVYQSVLHVRTLDRFPEKWAVTQNNLGLAYLYRIRGDQAENLEQAIRCFDAALRVRTREAFPQDWVMTQINLGIAYLYRICGNRAENLEAAITIFEAALQVCTQQVFPEDWAAIKDNLGIAYLNRIRDERAENLERAITASKEALEVYTQQAFPHDWAMCQNNLGNAYRNRIRGDQLENLETAIRCYSAALEVHTPEAFPQDWAMTQNNLGNAYSNGIWEERAEKLEAAICSYSAALQVYTCEAFPQNWAIIQNNLGTAYCKRIWGERAENLEVAIRSYSAALEVHTPEASSEKWAMTLNNLGVAYCKRICGERAKNLEAAIRCYLAALQVYTREAYPQNYAATQLNLGTAYQNARQFPNAYAAFASAIDSVEALRSQIIFGDEIKQKLAQKWNNLYQRMVEVCLELGNYDQAIEYVERSKARNLVELLATRDLYPKGDIPETVLDELNRLRREIAAQQRRIEIGRRDDMDEGMMSDGRSQAITNSPAANGSTDSTALNALRQQLDNLITQEIQPIDPTFSLTQRVEPVSFQQIQQLLHDDKTALIEWYILGETFITLIITRQSPGIIVWQSSPEDRKELIDWTDEYLQDYAQLSKEHWKDNLESLNRLAQILSMEKVLTQVPDTCDRVILIPNVFLHLFPLHALPLPNQKDKCLLDKFPRGVRYAPSCQLLQLTEKQERPDFSYLFGIQNPTQDLFYANLEVQTVRRFFEPAYVLVEKNAKKDAFSTILHTEHLRAAHCVHFSCHGEFNFESPLKSALLLADEKPLTLGEIFALNLSQCRLVTLSACETGLIDFTSISDEYIGLPSAFLYAGALSVVSSLWAVNDLSTCFLMIKFYENLRNYPKLEAGEVAIALNQAQIWLRDLTSEEFEAVFAKYQLQVDEILAQLPKGDRFEFQDSLDQARRKIQAPDRQPKPFANPYYWAAFTATGV